MFGAVFHPIGSNSMVLARILTPMFTSDIESERLKSSLSWNGVACKPICNPIVSNRLSILMHFALGHLLQTLHCPHPRAMLTALQLAETFCTAAEYSTLHVRRTGCVWTCPRIRAHFSIAQEYCCGFGVTCHRWNTLKSSQNSWTWYFSPTFVVFCGILWYFGCWKFLCRNSAEFWDRATTVFGQPTFSGRSRNSPTQLCRRSCATGLNRPLRLPGRKRFGGREEMATPCRFWNN